MTLGSWWEAERPIDFALTDKGRATPAAEADEDRDD